MHTSWPAQSRWIQRSQRAWRLVLGSLILAGTVVACPPPSRANTALAPGDFRLTVTDSAVSVEANEANIAAIFAAISQQAGIAIVVHHGVDQTITTHFVQVPFREAFKRLAPNIVILDAHGAQAPPYRVAKVYVLPEGQSSVLQDTQVPQVVTRPKPFTFTFDPSQPAKHAP